MMEDQYKTDETGDMNTIAKISNIRHPRKLNSRRSINCISLLGSPARRLKPSVDEDRYTSARWDDMAQVGERSVHQMNGVFLSRDEAYLSTTNKDDRLSSDICHGKRSSHLNIGEKCSQ